MKKLAVVVTLLMTVATLCANAAIDPDTLRDEANAVRQARTADLWFDKWGFKMTRGLVNTGSFWVELPRNMYVETRDNPIVGPVKGFFKGLGLSGVRLVSGVMDIATFGTVDDMYSVYDQYEFPYFVWQDYGKAER